MVAQPSEAEDEVGAEEGIDVLHVKLPIARPPRRPGPEVTHHAALAGGQNWGGGRGREEDNGNSKLEQIFGSISSNLPLPTHPDLRGLS